MHHLWLPGLDQGEQRRQICDDRAQLLALGLEPRAFAYPGGYYDATTQQVVSACGYVSARLVAGGLAESLPVADRLAIRISDTMRSVVPLSQLQSWVSRSEATGGWVNLVFHDICAGCSTSALHPRIFADFLTWLFPRAGRGTVVRTVSEMTGGPLLPSVSAAPATAPPGPNFAPNGSFEEGPAASPRCWQRGDQGERSAAWARITDASLGRTW